MSTRTIPGAGLWKGMWVTLSTMFKTIFMPGKHLKTVMYPDVKETPVPRARGVIALDQEACTVCMLCARNCPDWCIYIEGHKVEVPPDKPGGRIKIRNTLDRSQQFLVAGTGFTQERGPLVWLAVQRRVEEPIGLRPAGVIHGSRPARPCFARPSVRVAARRALWSTRD